MPIPALTPAGHWPRCHRSDSVDSRRTLVPTCYSVWVSSGCHNNIPQIEGLEQQTLTVSKFWKLEIQDQDAGWCGSWWGLSSWLAGGHLLAVCLCAIGSELYKSHWILGKEPMASIQRAVRTGRATLGCPYSMGHDRRVVCFWASHHQRALAGGK